jgi:predicted ATP-dependent endonuclease of OLD family
MKLRRLWIDGYKNLRQCEIVFAQTRLLNAVIGSNGSGKSNLIEAILHILVNVYFRRSPGFDFDFDFESHGLEVSLSARSGALWIEVDGQKTTRSDFAQILRSGPAQNYYPELTFVYYSGECQRVRRLMRRYQQHFERLTRSSETDTYRPLFVESTNHQSRIILLALVAHQHQEFLSRLRIVDAEDIYVVLRSPRNFDPQLHEPKLWNTEGAVRRIVAAIDETAESEDSVRHEMETLETPSDTAGYSETRTYRFETNVGLRDLAHRLEKGNDSLYLAFQHLKARGILVSVNYRLQGVDSSFSFDELSEGEKQLIAVIGALTLTNQRDNLVLLDEPDTHLNPQWSWEYPNMLADAFQNEQLSRTTVIMATHDPLMISGMTREQVWLAQSDSAELPMFRQPHRNPRGQGIANLICSSEFFGLPSSLDKETQKLLDERLEISLKESLTQADRARLKALNEQLEIIVKPGISERDPNYVKFLRHRYGQPTA